MTMQQILKLTDFLYEGKEKKFLDDILRNYITYLKEFGTFDSIQHSSTLLDYQINYVQDTYYHSNLEILFESFLESIKDLNIKYSLKGRIKSLVKVEEKILEYQKRKKSLDSIKDFYAFRYLVKGTVEECYQLAIHNLNFFIENGFILCEPNSTKKRRGKNDIYEIDNNLIIFEDYKYLKLQNGIIIPKRSFLPSHFIPFAKDYILIPKPNGYQSLQFCLKSPNGKYFEIQFRTQFMHKVAETGIASHLKYKQTKYTDPIMIHPNRINIHGFDLFCGKKPRDTIGLVEHKDFFTSKTS